MKFRFFQIGVAGSGLYGKVLGLSPGSSSEGSRGKWSFLYRSCLETGSWIWFNLSFARQLASSTSPLTVNPTP